MNQEASTMAAHFKALGIDRKESWSRWVQHTQLRPGMDAKDWFAIYDSVTPTLIQAGAVPVMGQPTHRITYHYDGRSKLVRVTRLDKQVVDWVDEHGCVGGDPLDHVCLEEL